MKYYLEYTPNAHLVLEYNKSFANKEDEICQDIDYLLNIKEKGLQSLK